MRKDRIISIGDKVELSTIKGYSFREMAEMGWDEPPAEEGFAYRTMIADIDRHGTITVSIPSFSGVQMPLREGQDIYMAYNRESGKYVVRMKVRGFRTENDIRYARLIVVAEPIRKQRRNHYRLPVRLKVLVCEYREDAEYSMPLKGEIAEAVGLETVGTNNISVTGIAISTNKEYNKGERYLLKVYLDEKQGENSPFIVCAEVMRTISDRQNKTNYVGMRFFGLSEKMSEYMAKYVMEQQKKIIAKERLITGDGDDGEYEEH